MKNIYDIFEQRKIDCIICDYNNIMESFEELNMIYNTLDNEYFDYVEEAIDFKKIKGQIKSGAKAVGNAIMTAIDRTVEFLKELWKKVKIWFGNIKRHFGKKKNLQEVVDEKIEAAINKIENEKTADTPTDFNKKKIVTDAEKNYRQQKSNERINNRRSVPLREVLHFAGDKKIKTKRFLSFNDVKRRSANILNDILRFIEGHVQDLEKDPEKLTDLYTYLAKTGNIKSGERGLGPIYDTIFEGSDDVVEMPIKDCINAVQSYGAISNIYDFIEGYEKAIEKSMSMSIKALERNAKTIYTKEETPELHKQTMEAINHLQESHKTCLAVVKFVSGELNKQYEKCFSIVEMATNYYIENVLKNK